MYMGEQEKFSYWKNFPTFFRKKYKEMLVVTGAFGLIIYGLHALEQCDTKSNTQKRAAIARMQTSSNKLEIQLQNACDTNHDTSIDQRELEGMLRTLGYKGILHGSPTIKVYNPQQLRSVDFKKKYWHDDIYQSGNVVLVPVGLAENVLKK